MDKKAVFETLIEEATSTKERLFYSAVYLFSIKGYANVGIRALCSSLNMQQSAFYNHYSSKEELFEAILARFAELSSQVVFTEQEIDDVVCSGDVALFFIENMKKFSASTGSPLYHTLLQIVLMESYTNPIAHEIARHNLYYLRKGYTEQVLSRMMEAGDIKPCNVEVVAAEYYYALIGFFDEYLLNEVWGESTDVIDKRIEEHIRFFVELLKK